MNWISNFFKSKSSSEKKASRPEKQIDFVKITKDWNADPVSPEIELSINGLDLIMDIYLNHLVFDNHKEGDKAKIQFKNCSEYSLNTCNDEGYYYGQYRTYPSELPWGEFYEIKSGMDRNYPEPIIKIQDNNLEKRHYIFFFKDETFECLASGFDVEFYNEK